MTVTLRDLITRTLLTHGTVTCAARADAILTALTEAGYTIAKFCPGYRMECSESTPCKGCQQTPAKEDQ